MKAVLNYLREIGQATWSLVSGMAVTGRYMFKPVATVQYPRARLPLPEAFRGPIALKPGPEEGGHLCVACGECARTCPSRVIKVQGIKSRAGDATRARFYFTDFSRCSLCGLCVEVCPRGALVFSHRYEQAEDSRYVGVEDLMARLQGGAP
jgi:NADH-quinone oxidoreductase subunit I